MDTHYYQLNFLYIHRTYDATTIMNEFLLVSGMTTLVNHLYNLSIQINFLISNSINFAKYEENSVDASQILAT